MPLFGKSIRHHPFPGNSILVYPTCHCMFVIPSPAQAFNSFGIGYRLAGTEDYKDRVLTAAESLYDFRYQVSIPSPKSLYIVVLKSDTTSTYNIYVTLLPLLRLGNPCNPSIFLRFSLFHPVYYLRPSTPAASLVVAQTHGHKVDCCPPSPLWWAPCIFIVRRVSSLLREYHRPQFV